MTRFKLNKKILLKKPNDIEKLFKNGTYLRSAHFDIVFRQADEKRVIFTVSKKVNGAVKRNRIKRLLREMYRLNFANDSKYKGHIAIIGKPRVYHSSLKELEIEFRKLISTLYEL